MVVSTPPLDAAPAAAKPSASAAEHSGGSATCSSRGPTVVILLLLLCGVFGAMWNSGLRSTTTTASGHVLAVSDRGSRSSSGSLAVFPRSVDGLEGGGGAAQLPALSSHPIAGSDARFKGARHDDVANPVVARSTESALVQQVPSSAEARAMAWALRQQGFHDNRFPELQLPFDLTLCSYVYFDFGTNLGFQLEKLYLGAKADSPWGKQFTRYFGSSLQDRCKNVCAIGSEPNRALHVHLAAVEGRLQKLGARVKILHAPVWVNNDKVIFNQVHDDNAVHDSSSIATKKQGLGRVKDGKWTNDMNVTAYEARALRFASLLNFVDPNATAAIAKLDIEGAEHRVLLDLLLSGNVCRLHFLGVELHSHLMRDDMHDLEFMSNTIGTKRKKDMSLKRMANVLSQSQRCQKTEVTVFDDET